MSKQTERPIFYEGQILGASDLTAESEYGRGQQARHNRYLHTWGIATGLKLATEPDEFNGIDIVRVTLTPGVAIDGTGREIVVPLTERLSKDEFIRLNIVEKNDLKEETWYPVFLRGQDEEAPQPAFSSGACGDTQSTRTVENYVITFGRSGDELRLDEQKVPDVFDGPQNNAWNVLIGFVQWSKAAENFKDAKTVANGVSPRYAGVQADEVIARGGTLVLRSAGRNQKGTPTIVMSDANGGELRFGLQDAKGGLPATPPLVITNKGDVIAAGMIKGAVQPGTVQIQSGSTTDGTIIPLPPGITEEQVAQNKIALHIYVTPRVPGGYVPTTIASATIAVPRECLVELPSRRVKCTLRWVSLNPIQFEDHPAACNYIVFASVPAATGS